MDKNNILLTKAIKNNSIEMVKSLINKDIIDNDIKILFTPLTYSIVLGLDEITTFLIKNNADVNKQNNKYNYTPLMLVLSLDIYKMRTLTSTDNKIENKYLDVFKLLLEYGADINLKNKYGCTALHLSMISKNNIISYLLVNNGTDINICSKNGFIPLFYSLSIKNYNMVKFLFNNNAKYNITNINKPIYRELDICIILYCILNKKNINIDICWIILELLIDIEYIYIIKIFFYKNIVCYKKIEIIIN